MQHPTATLTAHQQINKTYAKKPMLINDANITPKNCDDMFRMLETEGLIGSAIESSTDSIATTDLPSHHSHKHKTSTADAFILDLDDSFVFGTGSDDNIFDQFYLENISSALSDKKYMSLSNVDQDEICNSDDLNSVEMIEEMISSSRSPTAQAPVARAHSVNPSFSPHNYSPYAPYASWSTAVPYSHSVTPSGTPPLQMPIIPPAQQQVQQQAEAPEKAEACFNRWSVDQILAENLSIQELINHDLIPRVITHQHGSRFLQNVLKRSKSVENNARLRSLAQAENDDLISLLLQHLIAKHDLTRLCEDRYGNYSIQILFERGNEEQHGMLLEAFMYANILRLSRSEYGCRVVQKALRCIFDVNYITKLVCCLEEQAAHHKLDQCLLDSNANHVIQAIINLELPFENVKFIKVCLEEKLSYYSEHAFACRVVQCFIKKYGDKLAVNKLFENGAHLSACQSMYGNYVIQCIIEPNAWYSRLKGISKFRWKLITELFCGENLLFLSKNKFGSNVMECCIRVSTEKQLSGLIMILSSGNLFLIQEMIKHRFGNYVIKTLLNNANKKQQMQLIQVIDLSFKCNGNRNEHVPKPNVYTEILMHEIRRITMSHHMSQENNNNNNINNNNNNNNNYYRGSNNNNNDNNKSKKRGRYFPAAHAKRRYYNR